jgi:hypothetical protein
VQQRYKWFVEHSLLTKPHQQHTSPAGSGVITQIFFSPEVYISLNEHCFFRKQEDGNSQQYNEQNLLDQMHVLKLDLLN